MGSRRCLHSTRKHRRQPEWQHVVGRTSRWNSMSENTGKPMEARMRSAGRKGGACGGGNSSTSALYSSSSAARLAAKHRQIRFVFDLWRRGARLMFAAVYSFGCVLTVNDLIRCRYTSSFGLTKPKGAGDLNTSIIHLLWTRCGREDASLGHG